MAERSSLLSLKRSLESQLRKVQQQLQVSALAGGGEATLQTLRDDQLSERVRKIPRKKKTGPSWGLNPGPSEY